MGIVKLRSEYVDLWVPGVRKKKKKVKGEMKAVTVESDAVDDLYEIADRCRDGAYSAVIMDTFTKMSGLVLRSIVGKDLSDGSRATRRVHVETAQGTRVNHPTLTDYGVLGSVIDEWHTEMWPIAQMGTLMVFGGHEKLLESKNVEGVSIDTFGSLAASGQMITRNLPGSLLLQLRLRLERGKAKRPPNRVAYAFGDGIWQAKDRLGVFDDEGWDITVPRKKDETPDEHKSRITEELREFWEEWLDEAESRNVGGMIGMYGPPGCGKTLFMAALVRELVERTEKPCLYCDYDSEGSVAMPKEMLVSDHSKEND